MQRPPGRRARGGALSLLFAGFGLAPQTALAALLLSRLALIMTTLIGAGSLALGWQYVPGPGGRVTVEQ